MLESLDNAAWSDLPRVPGPAADVPALLRALLSTDAGQRSAARSTCYDVLLPAHGQAGARAVPFLLEMLAAPATPDRAELLRLGPLLERHDRFPGRTNVELVRVDRPGEVTARVWERGAGETRASGTGAVAAAAATHDAGDVVVHFPGGNLRVRLEHGRAYLTGPAERVE